MGKMKVKSSFKSLQEAITSLKPIGGPLCIQEAKTHSFRELVDLRSSFNYVCYTPSSSSSSSSSSCSLFGLSERLPPPPHVDEEEEEDFPSSSCALATSTMSSFSLSAENPDQEYPNYDLPKGPISSARFFFSPCTTKSIMEEAKAETDVLPLAKVEKASFHGECVALALASDDPYHDFRASMEEMVEAHRLREWPRLQELLHCYLRLNETKNHKIILMAFVDLLVHLLSQDDQSFSSCFPALPTTK